MRGTRRAAGTCVALALAVVLPATGDAWTISGLGIRGRTQDIAADAGGGVHVIWSDGGSLSYGMIEGAAVVSVEEVPGSRSVTLRFGRPRIAVSPDGGEVHTAWVTPDPKSDRLVHAWRDAGGWHTETVWERAGSEHLAQPVLCVGAGGSVHLIAQRWTEGSDARSPIVYYRKPAGGDWTAPEEIAPPGEAEYRDTAIAADGEGGVHAVWKAARRAGGYRHAPPGGGFGPIREIPKRTGVKTVSFGDLFVDAGGTVHHAFAALDGSNTVDYAARPAGGEFALSVPVSGGAVRAEGYDYWPAIGVDRLGRVLVAWGEQDASGGLSLVRYALRAGGEWTDGTFDDRAAIETFGKPSIAVTADSVLVAWRGEGGEIMLLDLPVEEGPEGAAGERETGAEPVDGEDLARDGAPAEAPDAAQETAGGRDGSPPAAGAQGGCGCSVAR